MKLERIGCFSMTIKKSDLVSMSGQELRQLIEYANTILHVRDKYEEMQRKMETEIRDLLSKIKSYAYDNHCTIFLELEDENVSYDVDLLLDILVKIKDTDDLS